jgi:cytochrome c oxidase subunit II
MRIRSLVAVVSSLFVALACGQSDHTGSELTGAAKRGRELVAAKGCASCHSTTGDVGVGPSWKGRWGTSVPLDDGRQAVMDLDYLARSVRHPDRDVVEGYDPVMPSYDLDEAQLRDLAAYLKAIGVAEPPGRLSNTK